MQNILLEKYQNKDCYEYFIKNNKLKIGISNFGCRIIHFYVDNVDICLGYPNIKEYLKSGTYMGSIVGRSANRIKDGKFILNDRTYELNKNENNINHHHGGIEGYDKKFFEVITHEENKIIFHYLSKDMEENYPGNLDLYVTYELKDNTLLVGYKAKSDQDTIFNPTNHVYFNLDGQDSLNCFDNILQINADGYTPTDQNGIPTGKIKIVKDTIFDFLSPTPIGQNLFNQELKYGFDHNYVLNGVEAAYAKSNKTGIEMLIKTNMPCMQLYTGGLIIPTEGKNHYDKYAGFCLEPQFCPNSINMEGFLKPILKKGQTIDYIITYSFK